MKKDRNKINSMKGVFVYHLLNYLLFVTNKKFISVHSYNQKRLAQRITVKMTGLLVKTLVQSLQMTYRQLD